MKDKKIPEFIYGTAWKEERTKDCVLRAVNAGFRAIDTANQKKHYREDYVGDALLELKTKNIQREQLFLQSKFTHLRGQDHRLPYDPETSFTEQVRSSFTNTLKNLHTDYLDSYLLHGPSSPSEFNKTDWEVWRTMEALHNEKKVRWLGVSNVGLHHLQELVEDAKVQPTFVQNRCYAEQGWDREVREFCQTRKIMYQGFSLLTANVQIVAHPAVAEIAGRLKATPQQIVFRFARQIGMLPLTGTTNEKHMLEDLRTNQFELNPEEVELIESLGER